jgi:hypothetical protein
MNSLLNHLTGGCNPLIDQLVSPTNFGLDDHCECGHADPEHSAAGACHACDCCDGDDGNDGDQGACHAYRRCDCRDYRLSTTRLSHRSELVG